MDSNIALMLKNKRKENHLSIKDVLSALQQHDIEISEKTLYGWESGHRQPDADTFLVLCEIYKIQSFNEVLGHAAANEFSARDRQIITAYHERPELKLAIDKLLDLQSEKETVRVFRAASGKGHADAQILDVPKATIDKLKAARAVESDDDI